jgi:hypothetical protein
MNMQQTCVKCYRSINAVGIKQLSSFTCKFPPQEAHSRGRVQQCSQQSPTTSACFKNMRQPRLKCHLTINYVVLKRLSSFTGKFSPQ